MTHQDTGEQRVLPALAVTLLACLAAACQASATPAPVPSIDRDATPKTSASPLTLDHLVLSREAHHLMERAGDRAWPGWGEAVPPVVVIMGERHRVIGQPPAGASWEPVSPGEWEGPAIDVLGPGVQIADGQAFAVTLPMEDLQALIDRAVGDGRITLDAPHYIRFVVHESFHAFQIETLDGDIPDFGLKGNEVDLLPELADSDVAAGVAAEAQALAAGLRAGGDGDAAAAARQFLTLRGDRRRAMSDDAIALERSLEWTEGLARYADISLIESAVEDYEPTSAFAAVASYPPSGEAVAGHLRWLDDLSSVPGTVRDRYYEVGAGEARLLDRIMPGWRTRALPGREALESLVQEAVEKADAGIAPTLRALARQTITVAESRLDVAVADRPDFWSSGLAGVESLAPLDGVLFAFPVAIETSFTNRGMLFPLDVTFFDDRGNFIYAVSMPACPRAPCDAVAPASRFHYALEVPSGSIRTLDAADKLDPGTEN